MWLHQKPFWTGEWMSSGWSEKRWWWRWCAAHQRTPFWAAVWPTKAMTNCQKRFIR